MILRNLDIYRYMIRLSDGGQSIEKVAESDVDAEKSNGLFWEVDGHPFGLGVQNGEMVLLLRGKLIAASRGMSVTVSDSGERRKFSVFDGEHLVSSEIYEPKKPHWNFFAMEDEDVDGFVWIKNVLASHERTAVFLELIGSRT